MHAGIFAHRRSRRVSKGFSLIEMIVVMGIIAVLVALILPAVQGARQAAWRAQCAGNLRQIGQAYAVFVDQHNMNAGSFQTDSPRMRLNWPNQLLEKHLNNQKQIFTCVNDDQRGSEVAPPDPTLPKAALGIRSRTPLSPQQLQGGVVPGFGIGRDFGLSLNSANDKQGIKQIDAPGGQETPGIIYLAVETGYRVTWNDFIMTVEKVPVQQGGGFKISVYSDKREKFYAFDLKGANGEILASDFKPTSAPIFIPASDVSDVPTSYGVNSQAQFFQAGSDTAKVLCLEYRKNAVSISKTPFSGAWESDVAPRHNGVLNVLFRDGSIQSMVPDEIDPRIPDIHSKNWLPNNPG